MTEYTLDDLKKQAVDNKASITARQKELYQYARDKGFNSYEAGVLRTKDKETIDRLAVERDSKDAV